MNWIVVATLVVSVLTLIAAVASWYRLGLGVGFVIEGDLAEALRGAEEYGSFTVYRENDGSWRADTNAGLVTGTGPTPLDAIADMKERM